MEIDTEYTLKIHEDDQVVNNSVKSLFGKYFAYGY